MYFNSETHFETLQKTDYEEFKCGQFFSFS